MSDLQKQQAVVEARQSVKQLLSAHWGLNYDAKLDRIIATAVEKVRAEAIKAEQARWRERIDGILRKAVPDVDGSGCDSGDPLDLTATEIQLVINELENAERL
jgi:hypothetical protein